MTKMKQSARAALVWPKEQSLCSNFPVVSFQKIYSTLSTWKCGCLKCQAYQENWSRICSWAPPWVPNLLLKSQSFSPMSIESQGQSSEKKEIVLFASTGETQETSVSKALLLSIRRNMGILKEPFKFCITDMPRFRFYRIYTILVWTTR